MPASLRRWRVSQNLASKARVVQTTAINFLANPHEPRSLTRNRHCSLFLPPTLCIRNGKKEGLSNNMAFESKTLLSDTVLDYGFLRVHYGCCTANYGFFSTSSEIHNLFFWNQPPFLKATWPEYPVFETDPPFL